MKRKLLGLAILALLLVVPLTVHAATAGKFTSVEGKVDVTSPGKEARPVNLGDLLNVGDIIRTKSKSKCEVAFPDGSILRLAENSRLRVNEFSQQDGQRNATLDLFRGKIQNAVAAVTGAASGESKYEVRTPTAVCGVRGTFFFVYHQAGVTGAAFREGTGYGYSRNRSGDVRTIHAGQAMIVSNPDLPPVIRPATASEMHQHQRDTAPSDKPKSGAKEDESKPGEGAGAGAGGPSASGGSGESSGQGDLVLDTFNTDPGAGMSSLSGTTSSQAPFSSTTGTTSGQNLTSGSSGTGAVIVVPPEETTPPVIKSLTPVNFSDATKLSNQPDAAFTVEFDGSATIYYNLDGSGYLAATGGQLILTGLPEGSHTMHVKGVDAAGNESPVITYVWTTDYTPPTITLSGTPAATTNANTAAIIVATNKPATYTYTLDGAVIASPNLANLPEGSHTFTVTATDAAGNSSTQTYSWTTDYTPPAITLSGTPAAVTSANTADITVSTNKPATYTYTLDGVAIASPNLANLPEGSHTFTVTATDAAGNSSTSAYSWTTLYSAPIIAMNPQATPVADGKTDIRIALAASESADFSTSLDGGPSVAGAVVDFKGLSTGSHTISVQATNQAGNSNTQSLTFDLSRYALTGDFYGCIGGVYGTVAGQVVGVSGYNWGGWDLEMNGSGNPTPNATWTLSAGGGNAADGYWISIAPGATDFNAKTLSGTSQLHYLSPTRLGSGAGTVTGSFDGLGQYTLSDIGAGSYTEKPLKFVSSVSAGLTGGLSDTTTLHDGYYYYNDSGLYSYSYYETPQFRDGRHYLGSMRYRRYGETPVYYETAYYAGGTTETRSWTWNASSGTWTEVPGTQSGVWDTNQSYITLLTTPLDPDSVSGDPDVYSESVVSYGGGLHGLLGGSDSFRSATDENPAAVLFLGNYSGSSYAPGQIWHTEMASDNPNDGSHTTYDGGAFRGYLAGIDLPPTENPGPRSLEGLAAALYVDPLGNAGYLTGRLSGPAYPEIGMFLMNGGLVPHGMSNVGVTAAKLYDSVWSSSEYGNSVAFAGSFGGSGYIGLTGSEVFYDSSPNQISTMSIVNYDANAVSPWGIYQLSAAGSFANPDSGAVWSGRIGGAAAFGAARAYLYTEGAYQYPAESGYSYDYDFTNDKTGYSFYREPGRATRTYYNADGTTSIRVRLEDSYAYTETKGSWDTTKSLAEILSAPPADSNRPDPTTSWTETWPGGDSDFGFWLATAGDGSWGGNRIGGSLSGRFLTLNKLGTIGGDLLGSYNDADGTWQAVSAGSWSGGTPLAHSALGFGNLSSHDGTNTIHTGYSEGLIGVTNVPWEGTKNALTIGMFDQQENGSGGYLWNMIGYTYDSGRNSAQEGYRPFTTGVWRDGAIDGYTVGIYKTADGKAGFIQGALAGNYYNDLGMWEADGSLTKTQMAAATNQYPDSGVTVAGVDFGMNYGTLRLSGAFNNGSSPQGTISGQGMMLTSFLYLSLLKADPNDPTQTVALPILPLRWGIFDMMFTGEGFFGNASGNTYSGKTSQGWSAKVGGIGPFTLVDAPFFYLGDITDGAWDADGNIRGTLTGAYQTLERRGTFTGPFFGLGNDGATADSGGWIGSSVGSYVAQTTLNAFGGLWGDAANGLFIGESLYTTDGSGNMTLAGEEMGLIAGLAKPWTASAAFQVMGMYDYEDALIGAKTHYLLNTPVSGYDRAADATADPASVTSGYFKGLSAGIWRQTLGAEQRPVLDSTGSPLLDEEGNPVTAPVPVGGSMSGSIRALSVAPETTDGNGVRTRTLGVLTSDDVAGTLYPGVGIWTAQGNLKPDAAMTMTVTDTAELPVTISILDTAVLPGPVAYPSSGGNTLLSGGFNTESAANGILGSGTLNTRFFTISDGEGAIYSPRWGIYNLMLPAPGVASGAYSGKPAAGDGWSAIVGGMGRFGYEDYRAGYWLATVQGDWSAAGDMTGTLGSMTGDAATFGRYLTPTQMGVIGGPLYGIATAAEEGSGAWQAASLGTWTGQPLAFVSVLDYACRYKTVFSSELAYPGPEHIGDLWDVLIGGTQSLWYETDGVMIRLTKTGMPFSAIGTYDHDPYPFIANTGNNIWYTTSDLYSYNFNTGSHTTYDGGAYLGLMGGTETPSSSSIPGNRSLAGRLIALYIDPAGNAGYLKGTLAGDAYPDIRMFGMDGLMAREQVKPASEVGISAADLTESLDWENIQASVAGNFNEDSVRIGSLTAENQYGDVLAIADWTTNVAQNWGIYGLMLFGGYETPKTAWEARIGGPAGFGAYTYTYTIAGTTETGLHDDLGYWLAEIQSGIWADGKISGMLDGRFVTHTKMGSVTGDLLGAYNTDDNTWQAVSLGTWEGTPTDFGGDWYHSTLYNYFGFLEVNSYGGNAGNKGAFGFQKRPDGNYDFLAIGQYYDDGKGEEGFGGPYIGSGSLWYGDRPSENRYMEAFTGGIWKKANPGDPSGTMTGNTAALYYTEDRKAGLIRGDLTGGFHEMGYTSSYSDQIRGLWKVESGVNGLTTIDKTASLPADFDVSTAYVDVDSLYADAAGSFGGNAGTIRGWYYNGAAKFIAYSDTGGNIKSLPFGIYNLKLGGELGDDVFSYNAYYTGKPAGASVSWDARIGGAGYFGYNTSDYGYWLATIAGRWDEYGPDAGHGTIDGATSGHYLTRTHMGTIGGAFYGLYTEDAETSGAGFWVGLSVGAYEGTPLTFGGTVDGSFRYFDGSQLYWHTYTTVDGVNVEAITGLWGGTDDSWNGTPALALGSHLNTYRYPLFIADLDGTTPVGNGKTTSFGFAGGRAADHGIAADSIGFYARENGGISEVGFLTFSPAGRDAVSFSDDGSGGWQWSDNVFAFKMDDVETAVIGSPYFMSDYFDGVAESPSYAAAIPNEYPGGAAISIVSGFVRGNSLPSRDWGIWQMVAGGSHPYSETEVPTTPVNTAWTIDSYVPATTGSAGIDTTFHQVAEMVWDKTGKTIDGQAAIAFASWADAKTYVGGGKIKGVFDPTSATLKTWQAITTGAGIETARFLAMANGATTTEGANAALKALNIPAVQVGKATLTQGAATVNNLSGVTMADVTFFANSTGGAPSIWATDKVSGSYSAAPSITGPAVPLSSGVGGLTADFGIRNWNAATGTWGANITSGTGNLSGGTFNGAVQFKGGAAGGINPTTGAAGTISGTAAGIATPPAPVP